MHALPATGNAPAVQVGDKCIVLIRGFCKGNLKQHSLYIVSHYNCDEC